MSYVQTFSRIGRKTDMINLSLASIFSGPVWQILQDTSAFGTFILIVLVSMSIMSWIIIINKFRQFREVERRGAAFRSAFARAGKMADAIGQAKASAASPMAATFMAGYDELTQLAAAKAPGGGVADGMARLDDGDYEIVAMTMAVYLTISLLISLFMNWYNARIALVER